MNFLSRISILFLFFLFFPILLSAQLDTQSQNTNVNLIVEGCNNNSVCELNIGEDINTCPLDCTPTQNPDDNEEGSKSSSGSRIVNQNFNAPRDVVFEFLPEFNTYKDVKNIVFSVENKTVKISWKNPQVENFDYVRIMKNSKYSNNPYDGTIIYEGKNESYVDSISNFNQTYYYTFFTRYKDGSFSVGQVFNIVSNQPSIFEDLKNEIEMTEDKKVRINLDNPFERIFFSNSFSIYDFSFTQNEQKVLWKDKNIIVQPGVDLQITLPKKDFFGPLEDFFVQLDFYGEDGQLIRQDFSKMEYRASDQKYFITINGLINGQKIHFKSQTLDENNEENIVSGIIEVNSNKISEEQTNFVKEFLFFIFAPIIAIYAFIRAVIRGITSF